MYSFGWIPDDEDKRDKPLLVGADWSLAPASYDATHLFGTPFDQNGHNDCVAQAVVKTLRAAHIRDGHVDPPNASRNLLWALCRGEMRLADNVGTQIRTAFKRLNSDGFCQEKYCPYSMDNGPDAPFRHKPPRNARRMAYDQRARGGNVLYRRIYEVGPSRLDRVRECVANDRLVVFGTEVDREFASDGFDPSVPFDPPVGETVGRHALVIVGYLPGDLFKIGNSWGIAWGDGGFALITGDYLASLLTRDLWVPEAVPWFTG